MLATAYAVVMALANGQSRKRYFCSLAYASAGVLLAAVQIVPTFELLRNSPRAEASYEFFTSFSMPRRFLAAFFTPYIMGGGDGRLFRAPYFGEPFYAEFIGYAGLLAMMLALVAVLVRPDTRTKFWADGAGLLLRRWCARPRTCLGWLLRAILTLFRVPAPPLMEVDWLCGGRVADTGWRGPRR